MADINLAQVSTMEINEKCSNPSSASLCRIEGAKSVDDTDVDGGWDRGGGGVDEDSWLSEDGCGIWQMMPQRRSSHKGTRTELGLGRQVC